MHVQKGIEIKKPSIFKEIVTDTGKELTRIDRTWCYLHYFPK